MNENDERTENTEIFDTPSVKRKRIITAIVSVIIVVALAFTTAALLKAYVFDTFIVDGISMYPTLDGGDSSDRYDGETLVLNRVAKPKRGDIVVFSNIDERTLVKRVIAIEGDTVTIKNNVVYLNGEVLNEPYAQGLTFAENETYTVPENNLFCMGDNREHSSDSRFSTVGFVPLAKLHGKCVFVLDTNGGIRIAK